MTYQLRPNISLFVRDEANGLQRAEFLCSITRKVISYELSKEIVECLKLLNKEKSLTSIAIRLGTDAGELEQLLELLVEDGILEMAVPQTAIDPRYAREINFFSAYNSKYQNSSGLLQKLKNAKVGILGLGGIGSWVAQSLARVGVGQLGLIDPDVVSISNLTHQSIYDAGSIGYSKVSVMSRACLQINPEIKIFEFPFALTSLHGDNPFAGHDLVINCADAPSTDATNSLVSSLCFELNIPHILCGGYEGHITSIGQTVLPGKTSCWFCYVESGIHEALTRGFEHIPISTREIEGGTIAPIAAISGNIQALEAIRVLTGYEKPRMLNRKGEFSFTTYRMNAIRIPRYVNCSLCSDRKD